MTKTSLSAHHRFFLLSVWCEDKEGETDPSQFRFRLEDPRTGEKQVFTSLDRLLDELKTKLVDSFGN